jgi:hypothetical protein
VKFGDRLGYLDSTGHPLTFPVVEMEDYIARKREALKPPAPGRAIFAKAGEVEYHLLLPEAICALDEGLPIDRRVVDEMRTNAKLAEPPIGDTGGVPKVRGLGDENFKMFAKCEQLPQYRSTGERDALRTIGVAAGMQKDRYDPSVNAGLVYMKAFLCGMMQGDVSKGLAPRDPAGRVWSAFKRLEAAQVVAVPALVQETLACYSAWIRPANEGNPKESPVKAKITFHSLLLLPDWLVQIFTQDAQAASPETLLQELDHERALIHAFGQANRKN